MIERPRTKLRVAIVTMAFPKASEAFACTEIAALRRHGVAVEVYSLLPARREDSAMLEQYGIADIPTNHAGFAGWTRGLAFAAVRPVLAFELLRFLLRWTWYRPAQLLRSLPWLPRVLELYARLERRPPDVLHLFWGHYPSLLGWLVARYLPGVVVSVSLTAYDLTQTYGCSAPLARRADVVRTHAAANLPALAALGVPETRTLLVYRGVDTRRAAAYSGEKQPHSVAVAARLVPAKRVDDVLRIFRWTREALPDAELVVLGDGPERARLERLATQLGIDDAVEFAGHVDPDALDRALGRARAFTLLSQHDSERLPNVVKEAMLARCACIVTRSPGIDELCRDEENSYIVEPGDLETAQRRLLEVLEAPDGVKMLRDAAAQHIKRSFDVDRCVEPLVRRWRELAEGIRGGGAEEVA